MTSDLPMHGPSEGFLTTWVRNSTGRGVCRDACRGARRGAWCIELSRCRPAAPLYATLPPSLSWSLTLQWARLLHQRAQLQAMEAEFANEFGDDVTALGEDSVQELLRFQQDGQDGQDGQHEREPVPNDCKGGLPGLRGGLLDQYNGTGKVEQIERSASLSCDNVSGRAGGADVDGDGLDDGDDDLVLYQSDAESIGAPIRTSAQGGGLRQSDVEQGALEEGSANLAIDSRASWTEPDLGGACVSAADVSVAPEDDAVELLYDPILNCYYDAKADKYYKIDP